MYEKYEVRVSAEDLEALKSHCKAIEEILGRYPYFTDAGNDFINSMTRVKGYFADLTKWVNLLDVK